MQSEIFEVKGLIEKLRAMDTDFRVFGASSHRYQTGPPLSNAEILAFEKKYDVSLPEDYRLYLQLVGDGSGRPPQPYPYNSPWVIAGAGPGYGIYPLTETVNGNRVSLPFPFEEETTLSSDQPGDDWLENVPGALEVCTNGCTSHTHLIVSGTAFGTIWEGYDYIHFIPTNMTFIQWMFDWVNEELQVFTKKPLIRQIEVGMAKSEVISKTGEGWIERSVSGRTYFENASIRAQLELNDKGIVISIYSYF